MTTTALQGLMQDRVKRLYKLMDSCRLCPRACGADRLQGGKGFCRSGIMPVVASANLHHGEEPPISGKGGSGTIFFTGCNMKCVFCQNYPISQLGVGKRMTAAKLADRMLELESRGAENVNFVTPTHFAAQMAHAIYLARKKRFRLPIVYNSSGYESVETLEALEGFVDIYLCDYRYSSPLLAEKYSSARDYPQVVEEAISEMLRQVGHFDGRRGVIVRHLVIPGHIPETKRVINRIKERFGDSTHISLMNQFFPAYQSAKYPEIDRRLNSEERKQAWEILDHAGLESGWVQMDQ